MDVTGGGGKLVRDRIPEIIEASGGQPNTVVIQGQELLDALHAKLDEEAAEVHGASAQGIAEEIADVLEVLRALAGWHGITWDQIEAHRVAKKRDRGGFDRGIWLFG